MPQENSQAVVSWLPINSFDELIEHEKRILDRIESTPNGAILFMIHPFLLLAGSQLKRTGTRRNTAVESANLWVIQHALRCPQKERCETECKVPTKWPIRKEGTMSLLAGFDFIFEMSNETILKQILTNLSFGNISANPPFEITIPVTGGGITGGSAHLVVTGFELDLNADDTVTLTLDFNAGSLQTSAPTNLTVCPLDGTIAVRAAFAHRAWRSGRAIDHL